VSVDSGNRDFPVTSWTLLAEALASNSRAVMARDEFARRYRRPILSYFSCLTRDRDQAEELTQGFFEKLAVNRALLCAADRSLGPFRHYLKRALANYWKSELRYRGRQKRQAEEELSPDAWTGDGWERLALAAAETPESAFNEAWVRRLLDESLTRVREICERKNQVDHYRLFMGMYLSDSIEPSWRELGALYGLDEKTARSRSDTVVRHFRKMVREILREETGSDALVDEELAALRALL
jgi:RNA polymerase sigma factor (sigma-70 family)